MITLMVGFSGRRRDMLTEMKDASTSEITQLLLDWAAGDVSAFDQLLSQVQDELRRRARRYLRQERPDHTLQPTALVNEVYLRLVDQNRVDWKNRAQFFAISAQLMRRILVDHARRHRSAKRGGQEAFLTLDEARIMGGSFARGVELIALDDALLALAEAAPRAAQVVELRFFGGLTVDEAAAVLDISPATIKLDWAMAKAWLFKELQGS